MCGHIGSFPDSLVITNTYAVSLMPELLPQPHGEPCPTQAPRSHSREDHARTRNARAARHPCPPPASSASHKRPEPHKRPTGAASRLARVAGQTRLGRASEGQPSAPTPTIRVDQSRLPSPSPCASKPPTHKPSQRPHKPLSVSHGRMYQPHACETSTGHVARSYRAQSLGRVVASITRARRHVPCHDTPLFGEATAVIPRGSTEYPT